MYLSAIPLAIFIPSVFFSGVRADAPQIASVKTLDVLEEGQRLIVFCAVGRGSLPISFTWRKDNVLIVPDDEVKILHLDDYQEQLQVRRLTPDYVGNYTCAVKNLHGSDQMSVPVVMKFSPIWEVANQGEVIKTVLGDSVILNCKARGFPAPVISIRKGDQLIASTTVVENTDGSLKFNAVTREDSGIYVCNASNAAGTATKTLEISLIVCPSCEVLLLTLWRSSSERVDDTETPLIGIRIRVEA